MNKCIFLDRDGVINVDKVDYVYSVEEFKLISGVLEAFKMLKDAGYLLIVITNQSGIAKGIYGHEDVKICHDYLQEISAQAIDAFYYSPYHETYSHSLTRKPGSLMFEKAVAKYQIDISQSWMIGDKDRDTRPAKSLGIKSIAVDDKKRENKYADVFAENLLEAARLVLKD